MSTRKSAKIAFVSALILLLLCGVAALIVISRFSSSAQWVVHTYEVQVATRMVESALSEAGRDRLSYVALREPSYLRQYETAKREASEGVRRVRQLTLDNPTQRILCSELDKLARDRIALLQTSFDTLRSRPNDKDFQNTITLENNRFGDEIASVVDDMQRQEDVLLESRKGSSARLFAAILWVLAVMLASAVSLLWIYHRLLNGELGRREQAESGARRLSAHVLELQDEERRRFSRELHDSLGQDLAAAKMIAYGVSERNPKEEAVPELLDVLERALQETRTISHLLHPPLLDELGIASATSWYVDGFSQRSGLQISLKISDHIGRLSRPVELVLFRVLQESLTNVHRHAKSPKAEVSLSMANGSAVLQIRDYGIGIPAEKLDHFRSNGTQAGVGLTGMRERVREQGGEFEIYSDNTGTEVLVTVPVESERNSEEEVAAAAAPSPLNPPAP